MILDTFEALAMVSAIFAILILGTTHLRTNLSFYSLHTMAIAAVTAWIATITHEDHLYLVAAGVFLIKSWGIPWYLNGVIKKNQCRHRWWRFHRRSPFNALRGTDARAFIYD
jgi:hydrogenase-4 membrane subunit HyfE